MGEFELIERLLKPLAKNYPGALDLADDAALIDVEPDCQLVIAKDAIVAGVHFLDDDPPDLIAGKLLRVNLSDLAAMGADPLGYLTVIARPRSIDDAWLTTLARGLACDQAAFGLSLLGGDTVSTSGPLVLTLTILGTVPRGQALMRRGARPGDLVLVSGTLGDGALGLRVLRGLAATEEASLVLSDRYRTPRPRLALGRRLRGLASAAIDVSDGLLADLRHILDVSAVGATLKADRLPLSAAARGLPGALEAALVGGDDYELLFTAAPANLPAIEAAAQAVETSVTIIGEITADPDLLVRGSDGIRLDVGQLGWRHF